MKRRERAVEDARPPRTIKVNGGTPAGEMDDPVDRSGLESGRNLRPEGLRRDGPADYDGFNADAPGRHCAGKIASAVLACEVEYLVTVTVTAADQLRQRPLIGIGRSDFTETYGTGGLGGATADRQHRQRN